MARQDILLDESYNMQTANGDFVAGDSDEQHVELLIVSNKAMFKQHPTAGAGLVRFVKGLEDRNIRQIRREIDVQLRADGYTMTEFGKDADGEIIVDYKPNY